MRKANRAVTGFSLRQGKKSQMVCKHGDKLSPRRMLFQVSNNAQQEKNMKRLLIVGGVAGGASAAARARRLSESAEIIVFERGPHVSFANCGLPYFVGGEIAAQDDLLVQTPQSLKARFNLDARVNTEVVGIERGTRLV